MLHKFTLQKDSILSATKAFLTTHKSCFTVESWLDKRGHSLVPLSSPGFVSEIGLGSSEHRTLLQK